MKLHSKPLFALLSVTLFLFLAWHLPAIAGDSKFATITNAQAAAMLTQIQADIQENYYDPTLHGFDLGKRVEEAKVKIAAAQSQDEALLDIAGAVAAMKDSHTRFQPPVRPSAALAGITMTAEQAGKIFPFEWPKEKDEVREID